MIPENTEPAIAGRRPVWKARSLLIALGMVLWGLLVWPRTPASISPQPGTTAEISGFAASAPAKDKSGAAVKPKSPAMFRFGTSYIAGFFLGWICRKSLKFAMLVAGAAIAAIALAKHTGVIDLDWSPLQSHISQSLAWVHGELGAVTHFLTGYLPSAAAALIGMFMGARRG